MGIEIRGIAGLNEYFDRVGASLPTAAARAVTDSASEVLVATNPFVPVDTGALKSSGHVTDPQATVGMVESTVSFGGAAADYAIYVHERLDLHHNAPTKAKFLEDTGKQMAPELIAKMAARMIGVFLGEGVSLPDLPATDAKGQPAPMPNMNTPPPATPGETT